MELIWKADALGREPLLGHKRIWRFSRFGNDAWARKNYEFFLTAGWGDLIWRAEGRHEGVLCIPNPHEKSPSLKSGNFCQNGREDFEERNWMGSTRRFEASPGIRRISLWIRSSCFNN